MNPAHPHAILIYNCNFIHSSRIYTHSSATCFKHARCKCAEKSVPFARCCPAVGTCLRLPSKASGTAAAHSQGADGGVVLTMRSCAVGRDDWVVGDIACALSRPCSRQAGRPPACPVLPSLPSCRPQAHVGAQVLHLLAPQLALGARLARLHLTGGGGRGAGGRLGEAGAGRQQAQTAAAGRRPLYQLPTTHRPNRPHPSTHHKLLLDGAVLHHLPGQGAGTRMACESQHPGPGRHAGSGPVSCVRKLQLVPACQPSQPDTNLLHAFLHHRAVLHL